MDIKAIETQYKGYRFRSRLEARWAVFYDAMGISWQYEPEGFDMNGVYYLPDFYLPDQDVFIEIKGIFPNKDEIKKCEYLSNLKEVYLFYGEIPDPYYLGYYDDDSAIFFKYGGWLDNHYTWCICPVCRKIGIQFEARAARLCDCQDGDKGYNDNDPILIQAYEKSRSARFEYAY